MSKKDINIDPVVKVLSILAKNKIYGPLDMLSRVEDRDEFYMKMAREALYSALRYVSTEKKNFEGLEEAIESVLRLIEARPYFAKELALKALAQAMSSGKETSGS